MILKDFTEETLLMRTYRRVARRPDPQQKCTASPDLLALILRDSPVREEALGRIFGNISRQRVYQLVSKSPYKPPRTLRRFVDPIRTLRILRMNTSITTKGKLAHEAGLDRKDLEELMTELGLTTAMERLFRLRRFTLRKKYWRKELIHGLHTLRAQLGHEPSELEIQRHRPDLHAAIYNYLDVKSVQEARRLAGFDPTDRRRNKHKKELILTDN